MTSILNTFTRYILHYLVLAGFSCPRRWYFLLKVKVKRKAMLTSPGLYYLKDDENFVDYPLRDCHSFYLNFFLVTFVCCTIFTFIACQSLITELNRYRISIPYYKRITIQMRLICYSMLQSSTRNAVDRIVLQKIMK